MKKALTAAALLALAAAAFAAGKLTEREKAARFPYDLGPDTIDVSRYPKEQQEAYALFAVKCSQCHTLARPINSPLSTRQDWQRFVERMHAKIHASSKSPLTESDEARIVDFLVFDSKIRKLDDRKSFLDRSALLKAAFRRVQAERPAALTAEDQKKIKPYGDDTMASPRP